MSSNTNPFGEQTYHMKDEMVADFSEAFEMYAKGRGYIHQDLLKEILELVEQPMPEDEISDIIETMCKGSNRLDLESFLQIMTHKMRSSDPIEQLRDAFKEIDADGSGSIDRAELKEMMMKMMSNDYTEEEIDSMIDKADLDGDGEIDFEEFVAMMNDVNG
ncbi:calmodulin-A-like isoform X1 [Saccostrea cucullata]|uniref:calmodulin-A-like isoform X1 n=1 Tax=Saccostrea echinata TaxID=191078 RepID=UPI002A80A00B|nr:calmodulin-A-like isoform X1 [Saccostrea echinata]